MSESQATRRPDLKHAKSRETGRPCGDVPQISERARHRVLAELGLQDTLRKSADGLCALPPVVLRVVSACVRWKWRRRSRVWWCAVRIVGAQVRCRMAIIGGRTPAHVRRLVRCDLHRGRAISARAAIRVHGAIAANVTHIRAVVRGRATAKARRPRSTIRVGEALVVRTSAGPDQTFKGEAAAVHSGCALGVGGTARTRCVGARRSRTALRGAGHRRAPVLEGNLCIARCARSVGTGRIDAGRRIRRPGWWHARRAPARAAARPAAVAVIGRRYDVAVGAYRWSTGWWNACYAASTGARGTTDTASAR